MKKILSGILVIGILFGGLSLGNYVYANGEIDTLGEMREDARKQARDIIYQVEPHWSDITLNARINDGQLEVVRKTGCLQGTTYYTTYTSTREYTLPTDFLSLARVSYYIRGSTNAYKRLLNYTLFSLDREDANWQTVVSSQPLKNYLWANKVGLQPPASSEYAGTNYLRIDYIIKPTTLANDSDIPFNGVQYLYPYHKIITLYAVWQCLKDDNNPQAEIIKAEYSALLGAMTDELASKYGFSPSLIPQIPAPAK